MTANEKVAALPEKKGQVRTLIGNGKAIVEISNNLNVDYAVIQNFAWLLKSKCPPIHLTKWQHFRWQVSSSCTEGGPSPEPSMCFSQSLY